MIVTMRHEMLAIALVVVKDFAAMRGFVAERIVDGSLVGFHPPALTMVMPWAMAGGI